MKLTIHGYSTALYATWYFIEELGILFDAGDGVCSNLLGKAGKIKHAFISHADRDHLTGLLQFNQLFAGLKPTIYYPKDSGSFPFLKEFFTKFDPHNTGTNWLAIEDKSIVSVKNSIQVEAIENGHVVRPGLLKSLSFKVFETKRKLKTEFINLHKDELINIKKQHGDDFLTNEVKRNILSYSADTPIEDYERYHNSEILIHEATFLTKEETNTKSKKNKHSSLDEVFEMVANIKIDKLILGHFSSRYYQQEIDTEIKKHIQQYNIKIPVYRIPVGQTVKNILEQTPIN
ncbi:MAG: MBL fold metallo-hydrolase [Bacteroidota bacterium]